MRKINPLISYKDLAIILFIIIPAILFSYFLLSQTKNAYDLFFVDWAGFVIWLIGLCVQISKLRYVYFYHNQIDGTICLWFFLCFFIELFFCIILSLILEPMDGMGFGMT